MVCGTLGLCNTDYCNDFCLQRENERVFCNGWSCPGDQYHGASVTDRNEGDYYFTIPGSSLPFYAHAYLQLISFAPCGCFFQTFEAGRAEPVASQATSHGGLGPSVCGILTLSHPGFQDHGEKTIGKYVVQLGMGGGHACMHEDCMHMISFFFSFFLFFNK